MSALKPARRAATLMIARIAALANPETPEVTTILRRTPADSRLTRSRNVVFLCTSLRKREEDTIRPLAVGQPRSVVCTMISDIYELSPMQSGMLFQRVFAPGSTAYFDQFSCRLTGRVDADLLHRAWQQLVDRHPVLRTSFHWEELDRPVQVVHQQATLPWQAHDWRELAPQQQAVRWTAYLEDDRARGFQPDVVPLMRAAIARLSGDDYYFCWSHHHLLLDGWCLTLVLSELFTTYECLQQRREPQLAPPRPYRDYITWLQRRDREALDRYWRDALRGLRSSTQLATAVGTASAAPPEPDATSHRQLSEDLTAALRALAARRRLTLSTLVQGAWALLLSRYNGTDDVVFGATVSGRPPELPGIETMLGVFINTVPVRIHVTGNVHLASWLADVQSQHVERERFAAIALSEIQKLSDVEPGTPLFDTNVIVMNYRMDERLAGGAAGLEIRDLRIVDRTDVPLTLQVTPGRRIALEIVYDRARFDDGTVTRMLGHVEYLLEQFRDDVDRPLDAFEIVTAAERTQLLTGFNATDAPLDARQTAVELWEARVAATPDAIALECDGARLTFRELNASANRLARRLQLLAAPRAPLGADALIAVAFARSPRWVAAILAIWKCGAAYLPIDPDYPAERIRKVLDTAAPALVLRDAGTLDQSLERALADRLRFASIAELDAGAHEVSDTNPDRRGTGADLAYVIFTSGSTGQPKGAMVEHVGMVNHILAKIEDLHLDDRSVVVQNASSCFDISVWQCFAAMLAGGRTLIYGDALVRDPAAFLARLRADGATVVEVVPSYLAALLDRVETDPRPLDDLQMLLVTGETVQPPLVERWFTLFPSIPMTNAYGPTEASDDVTHAIMRRRPTTPIVPIGRPLRNFRIYVVDGQLRLCPIGVRGELCVSGPGVGRGYLHDPVRTAVAFLQDPFRPEQSARMYRTGDIGWFAADGTILLAGRKDHQVKVRGYRIEPGDIEAALTALGAVREAAVVERRDRGAGGAYLAAYVSLRDQAGPPATAPQILAELAASLPEYMIPATCTVMAALPLTANGKIDRQALPAPDHAAGRDGSQYAAPRTAAEQTLAAIWRDVLGVERPGLHDNFFALGGDSILSMQIVSRASRAGLHLTPRDVFRHQTIAELAAVARRPPTAGPAANRVDSDPAPLAPAQRQFFDDVTVDRHHYNQSILLEVPAGFDRERCQRALDAVVRHHAALRLRFTEIDGAWRQSVAAFESSPLVSTHDLSQVPEDERAAVVDQTGGRAQASLDLEHGPLLRAVLFDGGNGAPGRLLVLVHHLAVDGVSWRVILDDLAAAYEELGRGDTVTLPPVATQYLAWAEAQDARRSSAVAVARALPAIDGPRDTPFDTAFDPALNLVESAGEMAVVFDEDTTHAFLTLPFDAYRTGPTELLLAAAGLAYADWSGRRRVAVDLEAHGRDTLDHLDVTRTVGWFTSTVAVLLELPEQATDPGDVIALAKEQRRRAAAAPIAPGPRPAVLLNYHGRVDQDPPGRWRLLSDPHGPDRSPHQRREYLFEINALVSGGRLHLTLGFSRNLHRDETARTLVRHLESQLRAMLDHARRGSGPRPVPADFPMAQLDQAALDGLLDCVHDVEDIYELSPTQQGLLFHGLFDRTRDRYFNQLTCVLRGALDESAFQEAWRLVTARHAALRTSFHWTQLPRPVQVVHRHAQIPWSVDDWSGLTADEREHRWVLQGEDDRRRAFDVTTPPLMRCALSRIGPDTYRFRWSQHHLLLDGWSSSIVLQDVVAAYEAMVKGESFEPAAPPPFRDHIRWLQDQDHAAAERFWRDHLDGLADPTPLAIGQIEMDGRAQPGPVAEVAVTLSDPLGARLQSLSAANHITLNTLFQGAWALLLSRHSGEADVVFGAIASGRSTALVGSDRMVGLFINTVPVRARLDAEAPVFDWLRDLQRENAERQVYSYSSLADVQRWSRVGGGASLFETILIFENYPVASLAGADRALSISQVQTVEPNNYPITLVVTPGAAIGLTIMFDAGRFDRATIDRTVDHLITILTGIAEMPTARVGTLPIMTESERLQIDGWNRTARPLPEGETVLSLIETQARKTPDRIAVICDGHLVRYGELDERANRLARILLASARLDGEARVVVLLRRSALLPETILAIWKCGAVYLPVDPHDPAERIATIVANARPALVIADGAELGPARATALRQQVPLLLLDEIGAVPVAESRTDHVPPRHPAGLAYVIYTSGSTGVPKGAMVEHAGFLNHVLSMIDELAIGPASVVAQTASPGFDISMWQLFAALVAGGTTAIYPDALVHRPQQLAARLQTDRVSLLQFVPSYLNVFLDVLEAGDAAGEARPAFNLLTHMVVIGEALQPATVARWFRLYPHIPLMNAYGPTEASDSVAHFDITQPLGQAMVPIGRPIQNLALHVVDRAMRLCPIGVKGEICIAGLGVGRGYLFDDARTRGAFRPDPFDSSGRRLYRTGDIGCYAPDGTVLFFGRRDFQVKVRGHRIELGEIESCLASIDGVRDAVGVIHESAAGDQRLCAYVTAQTGRTLNEAVLLRILAERLPRHAVPDMVRVRPDLPVMPNGKVDRRRLAALDIVKTGRSGSSAPATDTERTLARIWSEVLALDEVGVDESFFDLGGHSLKAIQIVSRINRDCGVQIGVGDVFEHATVRRLSRRVDASSAAAPVALVAQPPQGSYDTSAAQKRLWLASRTPEGCASYTMAAGFWLDGVVDTAALARAFHTLVERHEALRTVFVVVDGALRQQVRSAAAAGDIFSACDWTNEPASADATDAAIEARIAAPFDLARGPLFDVAINRCGERRHLLLVRLHHIVGDAGSIGILLREALTLYAAFRHGTADPALPPLAIQYRDFVAWQNRLAVEGAHDASRRYWLARLSPDMPRTAFAPDRPQPPTPVGGAIAVRCDLDEALTAGLRTLAARHRTTLFGVVMSAAYALLYRYTQQEDLVVGATVSRRDHPLLEHQVGCYIDTLVLRGSAGGLDTAAALVARTARVCRDALHHRAYPFERLLDDLRVPAPEGEPPLFDVLVDYVPAPGAIAATAEEVGFTIAERPRAVEAAHYRSVFLVTESDSGATLSIQLVFRAGLFTAETVDLVRARLLAILRWLAADGVTALGEIDLLPLHTLSRRRLRISLNTD
ncbi:MAG: amino acid adenylation domain-containing protein [Acidobacteriota bacterium]